MISSTNLYTGSQIPLMRKILVSQSGLFYGGTTARRAALLNLAAWPLHPTGNNCQQLLGSCGLCQLYQSCTVSSGPGNAAGSFQKSPMSLPCLLSSGDAAKYLLLCVSVVILSFSFKLWIWKKKWFNCPLRIIVFLCIWSICVLLFQGDVAIKGDVAIIFSKCFADKYSLCFALGSWLWTYVGAWTRI